jgi:hypothetical protein
LHKNLSLKTHPDKTNDNDDFLIIQTAYENNDLLKLIEYADLYNILYDVNIHLLILVLEKELIKIKNKIKTLKTTIGYQILINDNTQCINDMIYMHKYNQNLKLENEKLKNEKLLI